MLRIEHFIILVPRQFGHIRVKLILLRNLSVFDGTEELQTASRLLSTKRCLFEGQEVILSTTDLAIFLIEQAIKRGTIDVPSRESLSSQESSLTPEESGS